MIIDGMRAIEADGESGIEARVRFEDGGSRDERVFVSVGGCARPAADPNGLLLAAFLPAWLAGERRIVVEGTVCPLLVANLRIASNILAGWYHDFPPTPVIEAERRYRTPVRGTALFLSGGVDSLASLRQLTTLLPPGHPERPTAAVLIDYQGIRTITPEETEARFSARRALCRAVCDDTGLQLVTVRTNLRVLNSKPRIWMTHYHGAFLAAMGHFLGNDFRLFYIAATNDANHIKPWGSHPLLDPFYSSNHVRISHHGVEFSRLEKVGLLRDWPMALNVVNVCASPQSRGRNCGNCEKCVRTKLHLLVHGCLTRAGAFAEDDLLPAVIERLQIGSEVMYASWVDALPGLRALGRHDLLEIVERKTREYRGPGVRHADSPFAKPV